MRLFQQASIKRKQMLITLLTSGVALLLVGITLSAYEVVTSRRVMVRNLSTLAEIVGNNCTAALDFGDVRHAEELLAALRAEPNIVAACVYTKDGQVFASYQRSREAPVALPRATVYQQASFERGALHLFRRIKQKGEATGIIYMQSDLQALYSRTRQYALIGLGGFVAASLAALLFSLRLQRVILEPILHLAQVARQVAAEKNYSVRAVKRTSDEVGVLIDGFNEMLAGIQTRDDALQAARETLENRVLERTQELAVSEQRFRSVWESSIEPMALTDARGNTVDVNQAFCEMVRLPREKVVGHPFWVTFTQNGENHPAMEAYRRDFESGNIPPRVAQQVRLWNGEEVDLEISNSFVDSDAQGRLLLSIFRDVTERKRTEAKLREAQEELLQTSRRAGMAEVATNVLHNVGNVLNSVTTSASLIAERTRASKSAGLGKVAALLEEHREDLPTFLSQAQRGMHLTKYVRSLTDQIAGEQAGILTEVQHLRKNIEHIREIVAMQQNYARVSGVVEQHAVPALIEDALRMQSGGLLQHQIQVVRDFEPVPEILIDKHKVLQILVNLISNAKNALVESGVTERVLTLGLRRQGEERVCISVRDNGMGIAPENLTRIFSHGFTTRPKGHGFGLHSGALAAQEMGGVLRVASEGLGRGATFTVELPISTTEPASAGR